MPSEPIVSSEHPELHHYTTWNGLEKILGSKTLWATHYKKLNDLTEVIHIKENLHKFSSELIKDHLLLLRKKNPDIQRKITKGGGAYNVSQKETSGFLDALYETTFGKKENNSPPFASPHITSFCSHCKDSEYESKNGLLSQWFGYAGRGGYAIVFDTKGLKKLLEQESKNYEYPFLSLVDVKYNDDLLNFKDDFHDLIEDISNQYINMIFHEGKFDCSRLFLEFVKGATRFKHRAFREEREIRIVASPSTPELEEHVRIEAGTAYSVRQRKFKKVLPDPKLHISLFDLSRNSLPIRRIIVGPSRSKEANLKRVLELTKGKIRVHLSDTPYID